MRIASVNVHCPQFLVALVGLKADELDVVENLFLVGGNLWVGYAAECLHELWSHLSVDNFESGREIISAPVASFATVDATAKMEAAMIVLLKFI